MQELYAPNQFTALDNTLIQHSIGANGKYTPANSSRHMRRRMDALARAKQKKAAKAMKKGLKPIIGAKMHTAMDECMDVNLSSTDRIAKATMDKLLHNDAVIMGVAADGTQTCICNRHGDHDHK